MRFSIFFLSIVLLVSFFQSPVFSQTFPVYNPKRSRVSVLAAEAVRVSNPKLAPPYVSVLSFIGATSSFFKYHGTTRATTGVILELMLGHDLVYGYLQSKYIHMLDQNPYSVDFLAGVGSKLYDFRNDSGIGPSGVINIAVGSKVFLDSSVDRDFYPLLFGINNRFRYHFSPFFSFLIGFDVNFEIPIDKKFFSSFPSYEYDKHYSDFIMVLDYIFTMGFAF